MVTNGNFFFPPLPIGPLTNLVNSALIHESHYICSPLQDARGVCLFVGLSIRAPDVVDLSRQIISL